MIKTEGLQKVFRTDEIETTALQGVNLEIKRGEFVAIMGPSGCGKSTLLNILGLLDNPNSGSYQFLDTEVAQFNEKQRTHLRKNNVGFVFQSFNLIDELSVFENVELPLIYQGYKVKERKEKVEQILETLQIAHRRNHFPQQLSGGQQQRVAVGRAVVGDPSIIFADEPTGNLDSKNGDDVMNLLNELNEKGTTIVMVTHSQRDAQFANRVIRLFDGRIVTENIVKTNLQQVLS
ncbi:MAG: ABC transporter ATP-binding protein [Flavobacteriales bacterium]|nr:ABC transporter ATP-binding protein [Flavobacteriales bacterium]